MNDNEKIKILSYLVVALITINCLGWFVIVQNERATAYSATAELQSQEILSLVTEMEAYKYLINDPRSVRFLIPKSLYTTSTFASFAQGYLV